MKEGYGSGLRIAALLLAGAGLAGAQSRWTTAFLGGEQEGEALVLRGYYLSSSIVRPNVTLVCKDGRLVSSTFHPLIPTGKVGQRSTVLIRIGESREKTRIWKVERDAKSLRTEPGFAGKFVAADRVKIEFPTFPSGSMTAEFKPSQTDFPRIRRACGLP